MQPTGVVGSLPGIPQPRVDMEVPNLGRTLVNAVGEADTAGMERQIIPGPDGKPMTALIPNYGQRAIPRVTQGAREVTRGQYVKGATDVLGGINEGLGQQRCRFGMRPPRLQKDSPDR